MRKLIILLMIFCVCNTSSSAKDECFCWPSPHVLIPAGGDTRVGWINIYNPPAWAPGAIPAYSLVYDYNTTTFTLGDRVLNTSGLAGLPVHFPGATSLSGISQCPNCTVPGSNLCFSSTYTLAGVKKHYILSANEATPGTDYTVTNVLVVTASFAPAASGWTLNHIEASSGIMYGLFTNGSSTYFASIDMTTGVATSLHYFATCVDGLDFSYYYGINYAYLLESTSSTIVTYDITTSTIVTSASYVFPSGGGCGGLSLYSGFLFNDYASGTGLYVYNNNMYQVSSATPVATSMYEIDDMTTFGAPMSLSMMVVDACR
ncbi:MAG: hypothetical protein P4L41_10745 [Flavipsychrobacter sp.]|nr:hypothetical protein [Flavipsychrobacter sp.]